jgi:hypothetical protein
LSLVLNRISSHILFADDTSKSWSSIILE